MEILVTIGYIAICILLFTLAIAVHEAGHFAVALALGLKVERFSIGFGPALWKKTIRGVEYRISAIPLGGYVMIPDLDPEGTKKLEGGGDGGARTEIAPWKQIAVAVAGPGMNIVLAVVLAVLLNIAPGAKFGKLEPVIGSTIEDGPAAKAGFLPGDRVLEVAGHPVDAWSGMLTEIQIAGGGRTEFLVERAGKKIVLAAEPVRHEASGAWLILAQSETNDAARCAMWMPARGIGEQLAFDAGQIFRVLKGLVTPKEMAATGSALGGPVMIAEKIYEQVSRDIWDGLGFLRFLNMNLAVLNLLPIPVLDGGLVMFALFALVFRRRVPAKIVDVSTTFFMYLLLALMGFLVLRDAKRSWKIHSAAPQILQAAEKAPAGAEPPAPGKAAKE